MVVGLVLCVVLALPLAQVSAAGMTHQVTNVGDKAITVTWVTDSAETGYVQYGTSPADLTSTAYDERGQATEDDTHHVSMTGLAANTTYYYEIVSGGITYNNSGSPYQITTGPSLTFTMPEMISGKVYKADGTIAAGGAILYAHIGSSQVLSCLVNDQGAWALNIAPIRTADFQGYYEHSDGDIISLNARGGTGGTAAQTLSIATGKTGAQEVRLTDGIPRTESMSESVLIEGPSGASAVEEPQSGPMRWWAWLTIGLLVLGIVGIILKRLVFYHD